MRQTLTILAALAFAGVAHAQSTCQYIGKQMFCNGSNLAGSTTIGNSTFYNYNNPAQARAQGMPSSSQQIGNTRFYDNGVTRQSIGNTDFYSNGTTRQRIGNTDFYSDGTTCQQIGNTRFCN